MFNYKIRVLYFFICILDGCSLPNETVSAMKRAKTQKCQKEFEKLACDIEEGTVYPKKILR